MKIQRSNRKLWLSTRPSSLARPDLIIKEYRSLITPWKRASGNSSKSFIAIQRSDRKLWPFRTVHPAWLDQTSSSPSIDASSTPWKSASVNSSNSLITIQRSDRKLWPFEPSIQPGSTRSHHHRVSIPHPLHGKGHPETPVKLSSRSNGRIESYGPLEPSIKPGSARTHHHRVSIPHPLHVKVHPETPVKVSSRSNGRIESYGLSTRPSSLARPDLIIKEYRSLITPWKRASGNSSKSFIAIQRSDRKLWPFRTVHPAWLDQTSSSPSIDASSTPWKRASGNTSKTFIVIQRSDRKLWPFEPFIQPGSTRPHHHRVSIPHPLHGKGPQETPIKV